MKVLLTGGGTGGHITPLLAVARELKKQRGDVHITYVGEWRGKFLGLLKESDDVDVIKLIFAGKFRRYHGESWLKRLLDLRTFALNVRDAAFFGLGTLQAVWLLLWHRPDVVFIKGGFVGVPIGLAAALLRVPFITHDSDTVPGLANRVVGRWAKLHATAMPAEFYAYPTERVRHVGIPVAGDFSPVSEQQKLAFRNGLNIPKDARVVFVTGGSQGAQQMNKVVAEAVQHLLAQDNNLYILHQAGKGAEELYKGRGVPAGRVRAFEFVPDFYAYSGAADVVITRAGATSIAEFAAQGRACIVIPHPHLTGGHQLKNAKQLEEVGAVLSLDQQELTKQPELLSNAVQALLDDKTAQKRLVDSLQDTAKLDAGKQLAHVITGLVK